jgi:hypothetical protein
MAVDPFAGYTDRYKLYCLAHGAATREELKRIEERPGGPKFPVWLTGHLREWRCLRGFKPGDVLSDVNHVEFDTWLENKVLR